MTNEHQLGDGPIEERYRQKMNELAHFLDNLFNDGKTGTDRETGFVLLVFPFGTTGRCNYISNGADRKGIAALLAEQAAQFERDLNDTKPH